MNSRKHNRKKFELYSLARWALVLIVLLCAMYLIHWKVDSELIKQQNSYAKDLYQRSLRSPAPSPTAKVPQPVIFSLPTVPPLQESFAELLAHNPDTIGYLELDDQLTLPVVQRANDNEYYLTHSFDNAESDAGALFLDGVNRLYPADSVMIIYGHNMYSGDMFGKLHLYSEADHMAKYPIAHFDTIYENGEYVAFAAFYAYVTPEKSNYFNLRRFGMEGTELDAYIAQLKARSIVKAPVDVNQNDEILLLVTCGQQSQSERFVLALRKLRTDETQQQITDLFSQN